MGKPADVHASFEFIVPLYTYKVKVAVGVDEAKLKDLICRELQQRPAKSDGQTAAAWCCSDVTPEGEAVSYLYLPTFSQDDPFDVCKLAHEVCHISCDVLQKAGVDIKEGTNEALCYVVSAVTEGVLLGIDEARSARDCTLPGGDASITA